MEHRAIGFLETTSVARGIQAADEMLKAASVELLMARPCCPGKYLVMIAGNVGAVQNAVDCGVRVTDEFLVDSFTIGSVHPAIFNAIAACTPIETRRALGIIETYSAAAAIVAADGAVKAADIELIEIRLAAGLAGKSFLTMTGDVGSVDAAVEAGLRALSEHGMVLSHVVIPSPSPELWASIA